MSKHGQPKFNIGDRVVTKEGTVTDVVKIYNLDGEWFYSLENHDDLYREKNLLYMQDYDKGVQKRENIHIEYKFHFGDIVRVRGYGQELFIIIGFRAEIWRYKDSAWEDIIYELSRVGDGQWLEAAEEELTYITNETNARKLLNAKKAQGSKGQLLISPPKTQSRKKEMTDVDELLDMYNDYQYLFRNFGELAYRRKMNEILKKLEALSQNPFKKES
ncbi:hypothetical protein OEV98_08595 [Caldibacillus lycopersici]|uniref:YodN n=1 Tax=Perspicuibacillus lycopersici TaxID=1325689 RepID=A0AAE3LN94_9BACI|nr:hypothetical protein [Perspicuibacillus lycopersici]MCU9613617.1 hypothetical protein [Perspicuibacillus lycopersici]